MMRDCEGEEEEEEITAEPFPIFDFIDFGESLF